MADKAPLLRADAVAVPVAMAVPVNAMATPVDPNTWSENSHTCKG